MFRFALALIASLLVAPAAFCATYPSSDSELDALFSKLRSTSDPVEATNIESRIAEIWGQSPSDTANLLYARGLEAMRDDKELALELFSAVTELQPDFADAWRELGAVNFALDAQDAAMIDLEHALDLEPRHYEALLGIASIFELYGNKKAALEALRRAYQIDPHIPNLDARVRALSLEVEGRRI